MSAARADWLRSRWLVPATAAAIVALPRPLVLLCPGQAVGYLALLYWFLAPWGAVVVHFLLHEPRRTRAALSIATGLASGVLAFVIQAALVLLFVREAA
jgi:hypothetical protein